MMWPRLELLRELLAEDGSIWVSIDDNEAHYLKVMMDEVFGRKNFIANAVWQKRTSPDFRAILGDGHENVLVCSRDGLLFVKGQIYFRLANVNKKNTRIPIMTHADRGFPETLAHRAIDRTRCIKS